MLRIMGKCSSHHLLLAISRNPQWVYYTVVYRQTYRLKNCYTPDVNHLPYQTDSLQLVQTLKQVNTELGKHCWS